MSLYFDHQHFRIVLTDLTTGRRLLRIGTCSTMYGPNRDGYDGYRRAMYAKMLQISHGVHAL